MDTPPSIESNSNAGPTPRRPRVIGVRGLGKGRARGRGRGRGRGRASRSRSPLTTSSLPMGRGRGRGRGRGGCLPPTLPGSRVRNPVYGPLTEEDTILAGPWLKRESEGFAWRYSGPTPGPSQPVDTSMSASELFARYFTDEVWQLIVDETNRYAASCRQNLSDHSRPWTPVTVADIKAFIGMVILMGIVKSPQLDLYWSTKHPLIRVGFSEVMSRIRFEQIWRYFHLCNLDHAVPRGQPGYDKLFKVRKLLDLVSAQFDSQYNTHGELTIDEAMIKFKGRLGFKQYIKNKPTKWGIKVFVLSDATTGYVRRFQIYTGSASAIDEHTSADDLGATSRVVFGLLNGLEQYHPRLYVDNFYTSPKLFLRLYNKGVGACGTARYTRKYYPRDLVVPKSKEKGHYDYRASGPLLACCWVDSRPIYFLTTIHVAVASSSVPKVKRTAPEGVRIWVVCPPLMPDYQRYMRGTDMGDQLLACYNLGRRSKKWWKRVFAYILDTSILNAYQLWKSPREHWSHRKMKHEGSFLRFKLELAEQLIGDYHGRANRGRPRTAARDVRLDTTLDHCPEFNDKKLECVVCNAVRCKRNVSRSEYRHETHFSCSLCNVHLCISKDRNCWKKYHHEHVYST